MCCRYIHISSIEFSYRILLRECFQNRLSISFKLIAHGKIGHHGPPAASLVVQAPEVEADGYLFMKQMGELLVRGIVQRQPK